MNITVVSAIAIGFYLCSGGLLGWRLLRRPEWGKGPMLVVGLAAAVLHGYLLYRWIDTAMGQNLDFFNVASLVAWVVALVVLVASLRIPVENIGIALLPLAALTIVLTLAFPSSQLMQTGTSVELLSHILLSILAYSILTIAAVQALLLELQNRHLRNRHPGGFIRALPPLQTMETLLFQMIWVGFVLLTLSLFTGAMFLEDIFAQHLVHKTVLSIIAWCVFAILLWGRHRFGWRGHTAVRWTLWGFVVLALAYFGSKLVLELVLKR